MLTAERTLQNLAELQLPGGYSFDALYVGSGAQEILAVATDQTPTVADVRLIHKERDGRRNIVLYVAVTSPRGAFVLGPTSESSLTGPLAVDQAQRILQAGIEEPTALAARRRLNNLLDQIDDPDDLPGITAAGLFAPHYLATTMADNQDWPNHTARAQPLLNMRSTELIEQLGYNLQALGSGALLLNTDSGSVQALAVLMDEREGFDAAADRFGSSPVQYGLARAQQERVPWLIVLRGAQLRLYPARPDIGIGRRSQTDTYFEIDLSVVNEQTSGFLTLVFSAGALGSKGAVQELLDGSARYAADLGTRLRESVYDDVVPTLAVAVADEVQRITGSRDLDTAYRLTLKILFRLLFQVYAEDQGLLPYGRNARFTEHSLTKLANDFVNDPDRAFDSESRAIWDGLKQVWGVIDTGNAAWNIPAYNGGLFGTDRELYPDGHLIDQMILNDSAVGKSLFSLLTEAREQDGDFLVIDFRSISVRDFGSIYEGLLESELSVANSNLTVNKKGQYLPSEDENEVIVRAGDVYFRNTSGERKSTGSYFTKPLAVEHLLERALDPVLRTHLTEVKQLVDDDKAAEAAEKFFDFRIADLAMGSGHFLIAAIDRMELQMAAFLSESPIAAVTQELDRLEAAARRALGENSDDYEIEPSALLRRQIARRCVYGVDVNEIAVELARLAVWIHTFVPGLPISSLDHTLLHGNSLTGIGDIEEALDALEPNRQAGAMSFFATEIEDVLEDARQLLVNAANSAEATKAEVQEAAKIAAEARKLAGPSRLLFDAAIAVRTGELQLSSGSAEDIRKLASQADIQNRLNALQLIHMPFAFPEVFLRTNPGFDVLLGNPPWKKPKVEEDRWWNLRFRGLLSLPMAERNSAIDGLKRQNHDLLEQYERELFQSEQIRSALASGPFPGIAVGDIDVFKAFAWRNWQLLREGGAVGIVLPRKIMGSPGSSEWRKAIWNQGAVSEVTTLVNDKRWLFDMEPRYTVSLLVLERSQLKNIKLAGPFYSEAEYLERASDPYELDKETVGDWSEDLVVPLIRDRSAGNLYSKFRQFPRLENHPHFGFERVREIESSQKTRFSTDLVDPVSDLPVLTGKSFDIWQPDKGSPYGFAKPGLANQLLKESKSKPTFVGMQFQSVDDLPLSRARIMVRDVARFSDTRTIICCLVPPGVTGIEKAPYLLRRSGSARDEAYLLGVMSSRIFDWFARCLVELSVTKGLLHSLPVPVVEDGNELKKMLIDASGRLAAVDSRFSIWANEVGVEVGSVTTESERQFLIEQIDAIVAHFFELSVPEVELIFSTFHRGWDYELHLANVKRIYGQLAQAR